ncbi:uncharacterized protein LOC142566245 [Dermacentor variabilis]|uniref:uncharacterized protein LOC142566245 n=1 Tax=Dermacentor variabilis TaxID=34621 RepID=UPI003F5C812B
MTSARRPPYDHLKATLVQHTTETEQYRLQQLLTFEKSGHRKPSDFLRRMQALAADLPPSTDSALLRELFLQRLPPQVRMIPTASSFSTLESQAQLAAKIMDVGFHSVATDHCPPDSTSHGTAAGDIYARLLEAKDELTRKAARQTAEVAAIRTCRPRSSSRPRHPSYGHSERRSPPPVTLCWYHRHHGSRANQFHQTCSYAGNSWPEN